MLMTFESNNEKKRKAMQPYWLASFKMLITSLQWTPETSLHPIIFSSHSPDHYFTSFPVFLILYNASPTLSQLSKWQGRKRTSPRTHQHWYPSACIYAQIPAFYDVTVLNCLYLQLKPAHLCGPDPILLPILPLARIPSLAAHSHLHTNSLTRPLSPPPPSSNCLCFLLPFIDKGPLGRAAILCTVSLFQFFSWLLCSQVPHFSKLILLKSLFT